MYLTGYDEYAWKRLRIMASEDVGPAEPNLPATIEALYHTYTDLKKKKDETHAPQRLQFVHAVILLATARKNRIVDHALIHHFGNHATLKRDIPDCAPTSARHGASGWARGRALFCGGDQAGKRERGRSVPRAGSADADRCTHSGIDGCRRRGAVVLTRPSRSVVLVGSGDDHTARGSIPEPISAKSGSYSIRQPMSNPPEMAMLLDMFFGQRQFRGPPTAFPGIERWTRPRMRTSPCRPRRYGIC